GRAAPPQRAGRRCALVTRWRRRPVAGMCRRRAVAATEHIDVANPVADGLKHRRSDEPAVVRPARAAEHHEHQVAWRFGGEVADKAGHVCTGLVAPVLARDLRGAGFARGLVALQLGALAGTLSD